MVERVEGLPAGVFGFRLSEKLTRDEYQDELIQPIYAALERGDQVNLYLEVGDDFSGLDAGALWEDVKAAGEIGLKHRSGWGRMALVTNKDWIRHGVSAFGWLSPGELRVFTPEEQSGARTWVARSPSA